MNRKTTNKMTVSFREAVGGAYALGASRHSRICFVTTLNTIAYLALCQPFIKIIKYLLSTVEEFWNYAFVPLNMSDFLTSLEKSFHSLITDGKHEL